MPDIKKNIGDYEVRPFIRTYKTSPRLPRLGARIVREHEPSYITPDLYSYSGYALIAFELAVRGIGGFVIGTVIWLPPVLVKDEHPEGANPNAA